MILLVSSASVAQKCASALHHELRMRVQVAETARQAAALLREHAFEAIIFDQTSLETEPASVDTAMRLGDTAVPVFMNSAICSSERLVRETRSALHRRDREKRSAFGAALKTMRAELKGDVTAILLSSQLALKTPGMPPEVEAKLGAVCELAERMKDKLEQ